MSKKTRRVHKRRDLVKTAKSDISRVGKDTKDIAKTSISGIYNLLSSGFNTGVKGVKNAASGIKNISKKRHHKSHKTRRH